jgi:hypothetical protein
VAGVFDYATPPGGGGGGGCLSLLLESWGGFLLGLLAAVAGAHVAVWPVTILIWMVALAAVVYAAWRRRVGYLVGFLVMAGIAALLATACGVGLLFG